jgi:hypothetical protein
MALPTDHETLIKWRMFVISWWRMDINIQFGCFHAMMLGMPMLRADFLRIVRVYVDHKDAEMCNTPCDPDFDLREWLK